MQKKEIDEHWREGNAYHFPTPRFVYLTNFFPLYFSTDFP